MWENKRMTCPVCAYGKLPYPPHDYNICPCCGTEFGNDDAASSHHQLLGMWIAGGANWFFGSAPENWNPWRQLIDAGLGMYVPAQFTAPLIDSQLASNAVAGSAVFANITGNNLNLSLAA
jgi:hypothetical protein